MTQDPDPALPPLYSSVKLSEIPTFFELGHNLRAACGGQWLFGNQRGVCIAQFSKTGSSMSSANSFTWVANSAYHECKDMYPAIPLEIRAGEKRNFELFLVVQTAGRDSGIYAGKLNTANPYGRSDEYPFGTTCHELNPALPSRIWRTIGGLPNWKEDNKAVEQLDQRWSRERTIDSRINLLRELAEGWAGPIGHKFGVAKSAFQKITPRALREWLAFAGKREGIIGCECCDRLIEPTKIVAQNGFHVFYIEAQGVCEWAWRDESEDPYVWSNIDGSEWKREECTVSEFLIQAFVGFASRHARYGASSACLHVKDVPAVIEPLTKLGNWLWPNVPSEFYAGNNGVLAWVCENGKDYRSVFVGAKTEHPLEYLRLQMSKDWERVSF